MHKLNTERKNNDILTSLAANERHQTLSNPILKTTNKSQSRSKSPTIMSPNPRRTLEMKEQISSEFVSRHANMPDLGLYAKTPVTNRSPVT